jgi:ATP-dependent helicase/nuclease subunit B
MFTHPGPASAPTTAIEQPDVPVRLLGVTTPEREARLAMALVDTLRARGVAVRDIAVVVPVLDRYETALSRAAVREGVPPTVWGNLPLTETAPYHLCASVCQVMAAETVTFETICRPLAHGWVPPDPGPGWPLEDATLRRRIRAAPAAARSVSAWQQWLRTETEIETEAEAEAESGPQLDTYLEWLGGQRTQPTPSGVATVLDALLARYREHTLPTVLAGDGPACLATIRAARAVERMQTLVERLPIKYATWLEDSAAERSWATAARLCETFAGQAPGRREHANARAVDIVAAADTWALQRQYVIAVGVSAGCWPAGTDAVAPAPLRRAVLAGAEGVASLAPRAGWARLDAYDQFVTTVGAAGKGLLLTYHAREHDGTARGPSPLLEAIEAPAVDATAVKQLLATDRTVPAALEAVLPAADEPAAKLETALEAAEDPS